MRPSHRLVGLWPCAARERASSGYDHPPLKTSLPDGVPRFLSPANGKFKSKNAARENAIKGEAQSILEKRGFDSSFVTQAIELIHKRVRTVPATAQYYVAAFDREGPESMATLLKIAFIHEVVENPEESARRASDVLLDRLQSGRESRENSGPAFRNESTGRYRAGMNPIPPFPTTPRTCGHHRGQNIGTIDRRRTIRFVGCRRRRYTARQDSRVNEQRR